MTARLDALARWGDAPALVAARGETLETWSFAELARRVERLAAGLTRYAVAGSETVIVLAEPGPEAVAVVLALMRAGAVPIVAPASARSGEVGELARRTGCRRAFITPARLSALGPVFFDEDTEIYLLDKGTSRRCDIPSWDRLLGEPGQPLPAPASSDAAAIVQSSGATGAPKAVALGHGALAAASEALARACRFAASDRVLIAPAIYGAYPFLGTLIAALGQGAAVVLPAADGADGMVRAMASARPTVVLDTPRGYAELLAAIGAPEAGVRRAGTGAERRLLRLCDALCRLCGLRAGRLLLGQVHARLGGRLRLLICTGSRLPPSLARRLGALGWPVRQGYGLAEAGSLVTLAPEHARAVDSAGAALPGLEIRIGSPDAGGRGEILVRGAAPFAGYLGDEPATAAAMREDGWLRTGDLGRIDGRGRLQVLGRREAGFVDREGAPFDPDAVEETYRQSRYVADFALSRRGGRLVGLVVPDRAALAASGTGQVGYLLRVALGELGQRLPPERRIDDYRILRGALPRTPLGALRRHLLLDDARLAAPARGRASPDAWTEADRKLLAVPRAAAAWDWLQRRFPGHDLDPDVCPQLDLGIDSLDWVGLACDLEREAGVVLSEEALGRVLCLRDLLREAAAPAGAQGRPGAGAYVGFPPEALPPDRRLWLAPINRAQVAFRFLMYWANRLTLRGYFGITVEGREHLPAQGPVVVAFNHVSDLDHFVAGAAFEWPVLRRSYWAAESDRLFCSALRRAHSRAWNAFPVNDHVAGSTLASGCLALRQGGIVFWFPEGWRSPDGGLLPFARGLGAVLKHSGAPVVPGYIGGTFEAFSRDDKWPRPRPIRVRLGAPLDPAELEARGPGAEPYGRIVNALRAEIQALADKAAGKDPGAAR